MSPIRPPWISTISTSYQSPSAGDTLTGHEDWSNLQITLWGSDFADGVHSSTTLDTEMTEEIFDELNSIAPPPVTCLADSNGDTVVDVVDLLDLLAAWGPCGPPCPEDNDGNGTVDVLALLALLTTWGPCP